MMKRIISIALVLVLLVTVLPVFAMPVSAESEGGYMYEVQDGEAFIFDWEQPFSGAVTIPSELGGYPVTRIRDGFFSYFALRFSTLESLMSFLGQMVAHRPQLLHLE